MTDGHFRFLSFPIYHLLTELRVARLVVCSSLVALVRSGGEAGMFETGSLARCALYTTRRDQEYL